MFGRRVKTTLQARDHDDIVFEAQERKHLAALKFDEWVMFKDRFDRGLELFAKLDSSHCRSEKSWMKVAVILAMIDRSLGIDLEIAISGTKRTASAKAGPRSMLDAFKKWTLFCHTFNFVKLTPAEVESLSAGTQQFLEKEEGEDGKTVMVMPSLKYHFPPPPARRGLRTRPMTDDQKAMNVIFLRRVRAGWVTANREMREQLASYVEEAEMTYQAKRRKALGKNKIKSATPRGGKDTSGEAQTGDDRDKSSLSRGKAESKEENKDDDEKRRIGEEEKTEGGEKQEGKQEEESKHEDGGELAARSSGGEDDDGSCTDGFEDDEQEDQGAFQARKTRFMDSGLSALGIRRLNELLEEDEDNRKKKENADRRNKEDMAREAHEQWTRKKDKRRFRVPDEEAFRPGGTWKPPRFDFSGGKGLVRPNKNLIASTTLDIMRGQGMKYVHAISGATQGVEGDLEKSRRQIKRYNKMVVQERKRRAAIRQSEKVEAFQGWSKLKSATETAVRCLQDVDPPGETPTRNSRERWLEVGRALKCVDARLLAEWTSWTGGRFPAAHCQAAWDVFKPKACDTHSTSYSAIRETFLKLLRPGVDYREGFHKVVRRRLRKEESKGGRRFDERNELEESDLVLNRRELKLLLTRELGIVMRGEEIRRLVDTFHTSEDRLVSWAEFEKLTGGVREATRGDAAKRLERRCVWQTTCPMTGMPNAYTVSVVKGENRSGRSGDNDKQDGHSARSHNQAAAATTSWGGTCEIITLTNGELRRREELADRAKRLRILCKYDLSTPEANRDGSRKRREGDGRQGDGNDYDYDRFEDEGEDSYGEDEFERSDGEGGGRRSKSPVRHGGDDNNCGNMPCDVSDWPMSRRVKGLETLKRLSKANREARELRQILRDGKAPKAPKFWNAKPDHPDVGEDGDALTHELLLCWRPLAGTPVAFFSLEMSGLEGSKAFCQGTHREIYRDPPDADGEPQYQFWVQGLAPNTRYGFRVRAFNGFGPGAYAHGCFATRPTEPAPPVAIRVAPTEVCLRWVFGNRNAAKLRELRHVFNSLDEQNDGEVGRDELLASLDCDHPHVMALLKATPANSKGGNDVVGRGGSDTARAWGGVGPATLSVFDAIEAHGDEFICWDEIELHFGQISALDSTTDSGGGQVGGGPTTQAGRKTTVRGHFLLETCINQEDDRWKEVWKGASGAARVKMLEPGRGYRFRVRGVNYEGQGGPVSGSVVVNTLLATPHPPRVTGGSGKTVGGVWDTRVRLRWDASEGGTAMVGGGGAGGGGGSAPVAGGGGRVGGADKAATQILQQWAKNPAEDEGVSLDMIFSRFDRDGNSTIDPLELGNLLEELGVDVTEERLREAFSELDRGGRGVDGLLSLEEFEAWWTSGTTIFTVMRDTGIDGNTLEMSATTAEAASATTMASYKGRELSCEIAGLTPNTLYSFCLRGANARTRSSFSAPLKVMTAPRRPEPPVIIRSHRRFIVVKWYPGAGGACKYHLQSRLVEGLGGVGALTDATRMVGGGGSGGVGGVGGRRRKAWGEGGDGDPIGWVTVYEGVDSTAKVTGLAANSVYRFRVRAANVRGVVSEWSFPVQAATAHRQGCGTGEDRTISTLLARPQCAADVFRVDADDDIVVGDTIIFTERLYLDKNGFLMHQGHGATTTPFAPTPLSSASYHGNPSTGANQVGLNMASSGSVVGEGRWASTVPFGNGNDCGGAGLRARTADTAGGEFVGERTAAAHVLQDSFRFMRKREGGGGGGVLEYNRTTSRHRMLRLEVVWSTVSRREADTFVLSPGSVVERIQGRLSQFETFRAFWEQENRRKSIREEWALLCGGGG